MDEPFDSDNPVTIRQYVFQALGAASVCWENMDSTGIFQSERAVEIGDALIEKINELYKSCPFNCEHCQDEERLRGDLRQGRE